MKRFTLRLLVGNLGWNRFVTARPEAPLAQQRAASAIRNALLDDDVENCIGMEEIRALTAAVTGNPQTQLNAAAALANACATRKQSRDYLHSVGGMGALAADILMYQRDYDKHQHPQQCNTELHQQSETRVSGTLQIEKLS